MGNMFVVVDSFVDSMEQSHLQIKRGAICTSMDISHLLSNSMVSIKIFYQAPEAKNDEQPRTLQQEKII